MAETTTTAATSVDRSRDDVIVIKVEARNLDEDNTKRVHAEIHAAVEESPTLPFVLDLSNVKFLPSLTLGAMVRLGNEFRSRNQRLLLASLQPTVRQVVTITRLDRIFEIHDDVESAIKALRV
jgi:anti-sigma B factor antagonist